MSALSYEQCGWRELALIDLWRGPARSPEPRSNEVHACHT
jgi:hypothetical protein